MQMQSISNWRQRVVIALLACLPGTGWASGGFALSFDDVAALGRANAGGAAESRWASHRNPAAHARLAKSNLVFGGTLVHFQTGFSGTAERAATDGSNIAGGDGGNPGRLDLPLPDMAWGRPLGERFAVGVSLSAPFGITLNFDDDWTGRYHAIDTVIRGPELTPSLAWRANDSFSVGLGLRMQLLHTEFSNDVDLGAVVQRRAEQQAGGDVITPACVVANEPTLPGKYDFRNRFVATEFGLGWLAGMHWTPLDSLQVGLTYRSGIRHTLGGDAERRRDGWTPEEFRNDPCFTGVEAGLALMGQSFEEEVVQPAVNASADTAFSARLRLPPSWALAVTYTTGRWLLAASARNTAWSDFGSLRFDFANGAAPVTEPIRFSDSQLYAIGADYLVHDRVTLRFGLAEETSTVSDDTRTARAPDADRRYITLGLGWEITPRWSVDVAAGYLRGEARPVQDLAEASGSGNRLNGIFEPLEVIFGASRLRWVFG